MSGVDSSVSIASSDYLGQILEQVFTFFASFFQPSMMFYACIVVVFLTIYYFRFVKKSMKFMIDGKRG